MISFRYNTVVRTVSGKHPKQHVTEETVDRVRESFSRSPRKSIMLINTWQELEYRLDICRATTGAHIEVYGRA